MVVDSLLDVFRGYTGETSFLILGVFSVIYLYSFVSERYKVVYRSILLLLFIFCFNPIAYQIIGKLGGKDTYYRFLWILMSTITISIAICCFSEDISHNDISRYSCAVILVILCILGGRCLLTSANFKIPQNRWKLDQDMIFAIDELHNIDGDGEIFAVGDLDFILCARQYDANVKLCIGRDYYIWKYEPSVEQRNIINVTTGGEYVDAEQFVSSLKTFSVEYVVVKYSEYGDAYYKACGLEAYEVTETYVIYKMNYD